MRAPDDQRDEARPLRIGIVGFGRVVRAYYVPVLRGHPGIGSIAVADPLGASREAARAYLPSATTHTSHASLLEGRPDAILVASPPSTHLGIWNDAAAAGVPVFMEKPFVLGGQLARARSTPEARPLLAIDFNRRFWPTYQRLHDVLAGGRLGEVVAIEITLHVDLAAWSGVTEHRLEPAEGGVLRDLGSQTMDLAAWLLPQAPATVSAQAWTRRWPSDHMRVELRTPSGAVASCDVRYAERTRERVLVHAARGRVRLDDPNMALHVERGAPSRLRPLDRGWDLASLGYRAALRSRSMARFTIAAALSSFLGAVRSGSPLQPGFREAVRNVAWLDAASRALATGEVVELEPFEREAIATGA